MEQRRDERLKEHRLEDHYCGDAAWNAFVEVMSSEWDSCEFKEELVRRLDGHLDIAKVVHAIVLEHSLSWLTKASPALDGSRPVDCLTTLDGIRRLKSMLMRIPL